MLRLVAVCLIVPFLMGCAVLSQSRGPRPSPEPQASTKVVRVSAKGESRKAVSAAKASAMVKKPDFGVIAGKTDFRGLLKAPYVRLTIVKRDGLAEQSFFYIGTRGNQSVVPWGEEKVVEPGYFMMRLAPGAYKVTHIAIPVGSTVAEEALELDFDVIPGKAVYVGTLEVDGVKEKVRFGGVPLVRPGFAYRLAVKDEISEAAVALQEILPPGMALGEKRLFAVVSVTDGELPPNEALRPGVRK